MRPHRRPRALRHRLALLVVVAHALALSLAVVALWAVLGHVLSDEANQALRARSAAELALLRGPQGRLPAATADLPYEGESWLIVGGRLADGPRVSPAVTQAALLAARRPGRTLEGPGAVRLYATRLVYQEATWGELVTGVSLLPYRKTLRDVVAISILAAGVIVVTVGLAVNRVVGQALRPVSEMTRKAQTWSVEDPGRRFGAGPAYDEISELAGTLDLLLERIAAALRAEQLLTAEVAHELRGPLAEMRSEAELALRRKRSPAEYRESIETMLGSVAHLAQASDALMASAVRRPAGELGRCLVADAFADLVLSCQAAAASRSVGVHAEGCSGLAVGVQRELVVELLHPIVENACQHARSAVSSRRRITRWLVGRAAHQRRWLRRRGSRCGAHLRTRRARHTRGGPLSPRCRSRACSYTPAGGVSGRQGGGPGQ